MHTDVVATVAVRADDVSVNVQRRRRIFSDGAALLPGRCPQQIAPSPH
jgi:hypothetical protein